jgi:hypothetical protein
MKERGEGESEGHEGSVVKEGTGDMERRQKTKLRVHTRFTQQSRTADLHRLVQSCKAVLGDERKKD